MANPRTAVVMGQVQGAIPVTPDVAQQAATMAMGVFKAAEEAEFSGDAVELFNVPAWVPPLSTWFPTEELALLGLERSNVDTDHLLSTYGVDKHVDNIHGPVLMWILHNDQLKFSQGKQNHATKAGEWYVFDDRLPHGVRESKVEHGVYLCWAVPLKFI